MNTIIAFLGPIGGPEMFLIFMVLLLLFGAKKLPQLARGIGKSVGEFRKAREEFEDEIRKGGEELDNEVKKSDDDKVSKAPGAEP
ncbi:MAG TPA: twin-arginine translocase TatA/TatE family subunit, partial [Verrucomicrobiales bacterium]|nr:twin-arginine translocase TatA/TatE family subunit [Verrucomicrobiales bacterium]